MLTRGQRFRLGLFVGASTLVLGGALAVLAGLTFFQERDHYTVVFTTSVSGLENGSTVKLQGVRVGRVEDVRVDRERADAVVVTMSLRKGTPVRADARAVLTAMGITGLLFVEITGGSEGARLLEPGAPIEAGESLLTSLSGRAEDIAFKTEAVLNQLLKLASDTNIQRVEATLETADRVVRATEKLVATIEPHVHGTFANADRSLIAATDMAQALRDLARTVQGRVDPVATSATSTLDQVRTAADEAAAAFVSMRGLAGGENAAAGYEELMRAVVSFRGALDAMTRTLSLAGSDVDAVAASLRDAAENFEELARSLREDPSVLIRGTVGAQ